LEAAVAPVQAAVQTSLTTLGAQVANLRSTVYADLTSGPTITTIPTPIVGSTPSVARTASAAARTVKPAASSPAQRSRAGAPR